MPLLGSPDIKKVKIIMKIIIILQFGYCPLIWMFHRRHLSNKIHFFHERTLRIIYLYDDKESTFKRLFEKDKSVSNLHRNLQVLATEMFKISKNKSQPILNEIFQQRLNQYCIWNNNTFLNHQVHYVYCGYESFSFLGSKIWDLVPQILKKKEFQSTEIFKSKIKVWILLQCPYSLCQVMNAFTIIFHSFYIHVIGDPSKGINFPTSVLILFVWSLKERSKLILIIKRTLQFSDSIMLSMLEILSAFPNKSRWKKKEKKSKNFSKHLLGILVGFPSVA